MISVICNWGRQPVIDYRSKSNTVMRMSVCCGLRTQCDLCQDRVILGFDIESI